MTSNYTGPSPAEGFDSLSEHLRYLHSPDDDLRFRAASHLEDLAVEHLDPIVDAISGSVVVAIMLEPHDEIRKQLELGLGKLHDTYGIIQPIRLELLHEVEDAADLMGADFGEGEGHSDAKYVEDWPLLPLSHDFMPSPGRAPDDLGEHLRNLQSDDPGLRFTAAYHLPVRFEEYHTYPVSVSGCVVIARLFETHAAVAEAQRNALHDLHEMHELHDDVLHPLE